MKGRKKPVNLSPNSPHTSVVVVSQFLSTPKRVHGPFMNCLNYFFSTSFSICFNVVLYLDTLC